MLVAMARRRSTNVGTHAAYSRGSTLAVRHTLLELAKATAWVWFDMRSLYLSFGPRGYRRGNRPSDVSRMFWPCRETYIRSRSHSGFKAT